jgi:hypothetical protein
VINEYHTPDNKIAIARLPNEEIVARTRRFQRAFDLSFKGK